MTLTMTDSSVMTGFFFFHLMKLSSSFITIVTIKAFFARLYKIFLYREICVHVCTPFTQNCEKLFGTSS